MFAFAGRPRQAGTAARRSAAGRTAGPAAASREERSTTVGPRARAPAQLPPIALAAGAGVVQRQVGHDGKTYTVDDKRPGWRMHAESKLAKQLNVEESTSYTGKDVNFAKYKKDRGHAVSFEAIQGWIVDYLNGASSLLQLQVDARLLVAEGEPSEKTNVESALTQLENAVANKTAGDGTIVSAANSLLSMLNSSAENLTPTSKYLNSYVGKNFHPDFVSSPGGSHISATMHTKTMAKQGEGRVNKVLRTPTKGQRVVGIKGGAPLGSMSPGTKPIFENFGYETRKAKSANVTKSLSFDNPYLSSSTSVTAPSAPKKKIKLTPSSTSSSSSSSTTTSSTSSLSVTNSNNNNTPSSVAVPTTTTTSSSFTPFSTSSYSSYPTSSSISSSTYSISSSSSHPTLSSIGPSTYPTSIYSSHPTSSSISSSTYPTSGYSSYPTSSSSSYSSYPTSYGGGFSTTYAPSSMGGYVPTPDPNVVLVQRLEKHLRQVTATIQQFMLAGLPPPKHLSDDYAYHSAQYVKLKQLGY